MLSFFLFSWGLGFSLPSVARLRKLYITICSVQYIVISFHLGGLFITLSRLYWQDYLCAGTGKNSSQVAVNVIGEGVNQQQITCEKTPEHAASALINGDLNTSLSLSFS